jgi:hypothetical protein
MVFALRPSVRDNEAESGEWVKFSEYHEEAGRIALFGSAQAAADYAYASGNSDAIVTQVG